MAIDLTGLSGYALEFAKAMNAGKSYDEASSIATKATGGSGIKRDDMDQILAGSGTTSESQGLKYDPNTGYVIGSYDIPSGGGSGGGGQGGSFFDELSKIINSQGQSSDMSSAISNPVFDAPSEDKMRDWASSYASSQVNPLITAIQNNLAQQLAAQETAKSDIEAAYAGLPEKYAAQLEEARRTALESAIARGMGRSGVADWQTAQYSKPILESQRQSEADKAAKLAAIANTIAALNTTAQNSLTAAEQQRGALEAARMGELEQWAAQMAATGGQNNFNNMMQMANLYNNNQASSINTILQLLPLFMGGS